MKSYVPLVRSVATYFFPTYQSMDSRLHAFFREAKNVTLNSSDKSSVRDIIANLVRSVLPQPAPERVAVSCAR